MLVPERAGHTPMWILGLAVTIGLSGLAFIQDARPTAAGAPTAVATATPDSEGWISLAAGWTDYAPAGVPDIDQRQGAWRVTSPVRTTWTHDGPVAAIDALWWLDSVLEPEPQAPPAVQDGFDLLTTYGDWDDHSAQNALPPVSLLAYAAHTNGTGGLAASGTCLSDLERALGQLLASSTERQRFAARVVRQPTLQQLVAPIANGQPAVLLLGLWQHHPLVDWRRLGGHYVALSGVDAAVGRLQLADPYRDGAQLAADPAAHNDAAVVAHDPYVLSPSLRPGPVLRLDGYLDPPLDVTAFVANFAGLNPATCGERDTAWLDGAELEVQVEAMLLLEPQVPATDTPTASPTPSPEHTPTDTLTPDPPISATLAISLTASATWPPTATDTAAATATATAVDTLTPSATASPAPSATPTAPPTDSPTASPTPLPSATATATALSSDVCGSVMDRASLRPVAGADVTLRRGADAIASDRSDAQGHYCLRSIPAGLFALSVTGPLCAPHAEFVETAGIALALDVVLDCRPGAVYLPFAAVPRRVSRGR